MSTGAKTAMTLDDLLRVDGKAELIGGRIVHQMPVGHRPKFEVYQLGQEVSAEPTVPGWRVAVDWIFA